MGDEAANLLSVKVLGWISMVISPPLGVLLASQAEGPWDMARWVGAGFAGLVAGYLLVWYIPYLHKNYAEVIREVTKENKEACHIISENHKEACKMMSEDNKVSSDKVVVSINQLSAKIDKYQSDSFGIMDRLVSKALGQEK